MLTKFRLSNPDDHDSDEMENPAYYIVRIRTSYDESAINLTKTFMKKRNILFLMQQDFFNYPVLYGRILTDFHNDPYNYATEFNNYGIGKMTVDDVVIEI